MNQPILRFLTTNNYKNLHLEPSVHLNNLNVFIGSNGSGKSNFISCLKFLKDCLIAIPDENRGVSSFEDAISKFGGDKILDVNVENPAKVSIAYCFSQINQTGNLQKDSAILDFKLYTDRQKVRATISEEYLYGGEDLQETSSRQPFYYYKLHERKLGQGVLSVYNSPGQESTQFEPLDNIPTNSFGLLTIPTLLENSQAPPENTPVYKIRRELIEFISKWQFYNANNMNLNLIRTVEPKIGGSDIYLSASGDNLSLVLDNLNQKDIDFEDSINEAMKSIFPKTRRLRALRSGRLSLTVEWYFEGVKEAFYLNEMSDGTVRMLCWATILHSPLLPSLIVIDEPELGLHVSWMPILAEWIKQAATKTQIIITTHSPDLLDHFTDHLENVLCFYSENRTHFSVKSLSKEMLEQKLEEGWQLGDLYRVGDPTIGGWPW
ncbi:MAG: AAA family ATPase [Microcoleus sp. PH2017_10_PVI_O_A]|uniref:AAA family ATPase n=1 Tax=unclassified Microcoleus TaxID=2642155 RepID=UPI001DF17520|nr:MULTISPECIES: AAA family ATPase [unclassified Microcoleus]TAE77136.1 MAG: ATPase [Oscillatoriales cyanobacterium]MCC3409165.1 AAA family ATPase [Microcoleus sp. PH2017_10_PVI_O_A]MCC3463312.1 AAA family ATPase [Microcoleus sp. PH2017_11_PCY_U_A]MCC3481722.1 AAA family ATPase [Microcoleus sp. PH2017_12_PCY_D_A]MCC3528969.1 AAA family ATPase [Microcoleus sp. PH2017_21_RUC_O_A]